MVAIPLRAEQVCKRFGAHEVLRAVELCVAAGEAVLVLGPNGVGKSTLLGCISGQVVPDSGTLCIDGHDVVDQPLAARAAMRVLPQEVEFPPGLTGYELLQFYGDVFGDPAGITAAQAVSGLDAALPRLARTYSVGMRRRLAFACLALGKAALYVLDEPFAGVDQAGRARIREFLAAQLGRGAGVLLAVHDQDVPELEQLAPRNVVLGDPL